MKSYRRQIYLTLTLIGAMATAVPAANWSADFGGPLPAAWITGEVTLPAGGTSATFSDTIASGFLRLSDSTSAANGGSFAAFGGTTDIFADVKVGAVVNAAKDTNDDLGVLARADLNLGNSYFGNIDFGLGNVCIAKVSGFTSGVDLACTADGSLSTSESYYIELSATGAATTNLKLDVFDMAGGTLLHTVNASDDGTIPNFGSAYLGGISGVYMVPLGATVQDAAANPINGTFDDVFSVVIPEPSTVSLVLLACLGFARLRRRTRI